MNIFDIESFMPHGHCYLWQTDILLLNVGGDVIIALCYLVIPALLSIILIKREDLPFRETIWVFIVFVFFCALTHIIEVINVWYPYYMLAGIIKTLTAIISVIAAYVIVKNIHKILSLPSLHNLDQRVFDNMYHVMQRLPVGVIFSNQEGKILYHNEYISELFGFSHDELIGQEVEMLMDPSLREKHHQYKSEYFTNPTEKKMGGGRVLKGQTKAGLSKYLEVGLRPIEMQSKDHSTTLVTIKDITQETHRKKEIEEALHLVNIATYRMPSLLSYLNTDGYYVLVNGAYGKRWGIKPQEIIGKHYSEILSKDISEVVSEKMSLALGGEEQNFQIKVNFPDQMNCEMDVFYIPHVNDDSGKVEGVVVLAHDITELNQTLRHLEISNKQLEEYAFLVSHDLRAPVRHISNFIELLYNEINSDEPDQKKVEKHMGVITDNSKKVQGMITGMLKIASIYDITPSKSSFFLEDILGGLKDRYQNKATITISDQDRIEIYSDQDLLNSVLINLIENSIAFAKKGKAKIDIELKELKNSIQIDYQDHGVGISKEVAKSIFDPFKKSENSKGLGLGMAIVVRSLEKVNGSIKCTPSTKGAKFTIKLPK